MRPLVNRPPLSTSPSVVGSSLSVDRFDGLVIKAANDQDARMAALVTTDRGQQVARRSQALACHKSCPVEQSSRCPFPHPPHSTYPPPPSRHFSTEPTFFQTASTPPVSPLQGARVRRLVHASRVRQSEPDCPGIRRPVLSDSPPGAASLRLGRSSVHVPQWPERPLRFSPNYSP